MLKLWSLAGYKNFGDALSPILVQEMLGQPVISTGSTNSEMVAVGSLFAYGRALYRDKTSLMSIEGLKTIRLRLMNSVSPPIKVWGTGFLYESIPRNPLPIRSLDVRAVRGRYTLDILQRTGLCAHGSHVVFGDPGLFYASLLHELPSKEYDLGVVPHEVDRYAGEFVVEALAKQGVRVKYIDVCDDPLQVVSEIASCDKILSSSLHGLIVADSLGIPNRQMMLSYFGYTKDRFLFKFRDYYSAFGEEMPNPLTPLEVFGRAKDIITLIGGRSVVCPERIYECRSKLLSSFPYELSDAKRWMRYG